MKRSGGKMCSLKQKVMFIFREVIDRASPKRDEQTDANTKKPASVCIVRFDYICCECRYATPASPACCASCHSYDPEGLKSRRESVH